MHMGWRVLRGLLLIRYAAMRLWGIGTNLFGCDWVAQQGQVNQLFEAAQRL
jgi:hypothetical protein